MEDRTEDFKSQNPELHPRKQLSYKNVEKHL